jgi:DNA-binding XRE family transcriptional regulator
MEPLVTANSWQPGRRHYSNYSWQTAPAATFSLVGVLGDELREERVRARLTQEKLAARAGVSRNYISLLELNQKSPTVQMLFKLCRVLKTRPSVLIARVEDRDSR